MTLEDLLKTFERTARDVVLTVGTSKKIYCSRENYDILAFPEWVKSEKEKQELIEMYKKSRKKENITMLPETSWWDEAKDMKVVTWDMISSSNKGQRELWVFLSEVSE